MNSVFNIPNQRSLIAIFFLLFLQCLNAPRNNKYDPDNPNKSEIGGFIYEPDSLGVPGALVDLINCADSNTERDIADSSGYYSFTHINPGIYTIVVRNKHYKDLVFENESLWAGTKLSSYNFFLTTFHFEDDEINNPPYGFTIITGDWRVVLESEDNQVLRGKDSSDGNPAILFFRNPQRAFLLKVNLKIAPLSGENWETGVLLWYQDSLNYYCITLKKTFAQFSLVKNGIVTVFYTKLLNIAENSWHYLSSIYTGDGLLFYLDNTFLFPVSLIGRVFDNGFWGLYVASHEPGVDVTVDFDELYLKIP
ncbi:MAG: carboxypeptidase-like regulatory domain-containing protein [candidate division WOR-3 bacterium]